jgi:naphthalene 1,2-dioxygenase system ferredoxin subunit
MRGETGGSGAHGRRRRAAGIYNARRICSVSPQRIGRASEADGIMSDEAGWVRVAASGEVAEGEVIGVAVAGRDIAIYNLDGELYATDDICTHAYARLSEGWLDRNEIECPLHAGRFDVRTGAATSPPCVDPVKTYEVRLAGDEIQVKLD